MPAFDVGQLERVERVAAFKDADEALVGKLCAVHLDDTQGPELALLGERFEQLVVDEHGATEPEVLDRGQRGRRGREGPDAFE